MKHRRTFLTVALAAAALPFARSFTSDSSLAGESKTSFKYTLTNSEWQAKLSPAAYQVLRHENTERPYSSPLNDEKRSGTFICAGCDLPLFSSKTKYDSGTGWPSFYRPLENAVGTTTDYKIGFPRTEVHCARCGGHLGHVFKDGPKPTGLRYCMNGLSLTFQPAKVA